MSDLGRKRRRIVVVGVVSAALVIVGVVAVVYGFLRHAGDHARRPERVSTHTAPVVRQTLENLVTTTGAIGYQGPRVLRGAGTGVITELPRKGAITKRGTTLFRIDDQPVSVLFGDTPLFRPINKIGLEGADVYVVADNLNRLGYFGGYLPDDPHDMVFSRTLRADLKQWQHSIGASPTGVLLPAQAVVLPGQLRVGTVTASLGDPADEQVAVLTSTAKRITGRGPVDLISGPARLTLPDGSVVSGRVTASADSGSRVPFTARPTDSSVLDHLDHGSVTVAVTTQIHRNVLAVPIVALLALQGGTRYAVEEPDGRLIQVTTGMFTSDMVEVSGPGLHPGLKVVTAS